MTPLKSAGDDAHSRAFEDIKTVKGMIKKRLNDGQQIASRPSDGAVPSLEMSTTGQ